MSGDLWHWPAAGVAPLLSDAGFVAAMLRVEVTLARVQARLGLIPLDAAEAIALAAADFAPELGRFARDAAHAGSPAIPFVEALTAHVATRDASAAGWVHQGATSQDVVDTALALCLRPAMAAIDQALARAEAAAVALSARHAAVPVLARTLMQPAGVVTIGFKTAHWACALSHVRQRLARSTDQGLCVSLGGATGALAAYADAGERLRAALASELGLRDPMASWHTRREGLVGCAADAGLAGGAMRKIARDLALMMQADTGEAQEPAAAGRGGSTAMPHKRNPVLCLRVLACLQPVSGIVAALMDGMAQEHERGLGTWQSELGLCRDLVENVHAAAAALAELLEGVRFDPRQCRENIEATHGLIFSEPLAALLAPALGRAAAQALVGEWCAEAASSGRHLREVAVQRLAERSGLTLSAAQIGQAFDADHAAAPAVRQARALVEWIGAPQPGTVN